MESIGYSQEINYLAQFAGVHEPRECASEVRAHGNAPAVKRVLRDRSLFFVFFFLVEGGERGEVRGDRR